MSKQNESRKYARQTMQRCRDIVLHTAVYVDRLDRMFDKGDYPEHKEALNLLKRTVVDQLDLLDWLLEHT